MTPRTAVAKAPGRVGGSVSGFPGVEVSSGGGAGWVLADRSRDLGSAFGAQVSRKQAREFRLRPPKAGETFGPAEETRWRRHGARVFGRMRHNSTAASCRGSGARGRLPPRLRSQVVRAKKGVGQVLIHPWDRPLDDDEWRQFVKAQGFGHLVAAGREREFPVVVPTQFALTVGEGGGDLILMHLARPNPIWAVLAENPRVVMSVAGDWAYIPASWKAIGDEDPAYGIPTTYYAAAQLCGTAEVVDDTEAIAEILRRQLGTLPRDEGQVDPSEHGSKLRTIRGLRIPVTEVRAKFKYGGNVDAAHRLSVAERLVVRDGPGDRAAVRHLERHLAAEEA
jgi:transcriptional regulator